LYKNALNACDILLNLKLYYKNIYIMSNTHNSLYNKKIVIYLLQIVLIYNALSSGWSVKKINNKKYELTKDTKLEKEFCLSSFLNNMLVIKN